MVSSPAGNRRRFVARDSPGAPAGHIPTAVQLIGHAGLAIQSPEGSPRVARWPSFPDIGDRRTHHVQRVVVGLWRSHASIGGLCRGVADVHRAAVQLYQGPQESLANLAGLPWRGRLLLDIAQMRDDVAAEGVCLHHWVVSERLVEEAHSFGLHVNAWTVNNPFAARRVAAAGVDSITTDRVDLVRVALRPHDLPDPRLGAGRPLRAVARTSPR